MGIRVDTSRVNAEFAMSYRIQLRSSAVTLNYSFIDTLSFLTSVEVCFKIITKRFAVIHMVIQLLQKCGESGKGLIV